MFVYYLLLICHDLHQEPDGGHGSTSDTSCLMDAGALLFTCGSVAMATSALEQPPLWPLTSNHSHRTCTPPTDVTNHFTLHKHAELKRTGPIRVVHLLADIHVNSYWENTLDLCWFVIDDTDFFDIDCLNKHQLENKSRKTLLPLHFSIQVWN